MRSRLINIIKQYFSNFYYFFSFLRYRIFILLLMSIMVGLLDGFGLAMFLPLLEMIANKTGTTSDSQMGNLVFIVDFIHSLGFELTLVTILFSMLFFFVFKGIFTFITSYLNVKYQQYFVRNLRELNIKLLSQFSYESFILTDAGRIQDTMSTDMVRVVQAYGNYMNVMKLSVTILVYASLAFLANPEFALLVAIGGIISNLLFYTLYKKTKLHSRKLVKSSQGFQSLLLQQVAFFKYLKATGMIKTYAKKLIEKIYEIENSQKKIGLLNGIMQSVREPMLIVVVIAVILIQVKLLGGSLGLIILSILFFYRALNQVMLLQANWNQFLSFSGSFENLQDFISELRKGKEKYGKINFKMFYNNIKLKNVKFAYTQKPTLNKISLHISKNETVAFVGESGSGKTTLMNIISGLIMPQNGKFTIDDIHISDINIQTYANRIGYITQEPVIFDDTIYNNVSFWSEKSEANFIKFYEALQKANIYNFVMGLVDKENTLLGNNGINISGGQKQRISIARELYKDIDILIMDEATSALDSETEIAIKNNIDALKGKYTILIVAHRLSTIKNADRIVFMKNGSIEGINSYENLIKQNSDFKHIVELQDL